MGTFIKEFILNNNHYVDNQELAQEIEKSKLTYCDFVSPNYKHYDEIIHDIVDATKPDTTYRLMTYSHIPAGKNSKSQIPAAKSKAKTPFPPFIHVILVDGKHITVGRSHYKKGEFSPMSGRMTDKMGLMIYKIMNKLGNDPSFSGYSYINDMKSHGSLLAIQYGLSFDPYKSDNAFAYITSIVRRGFLKIIEKEKYHSSIKQEYYKEMVAK